jgi:hypothetical protein
MLTGCEGGPAASLTSMKPTTRAADDEQLQVKYREQYLTERDPEALQWLLANRVRQGMTVDEVSEVLGQDGRREFDDGKLKKGNPAFRADDKTYRWGPDSSGRAIFFIFRDGTLVDFDPREFEAGVI